MAAEKEGNMKNSQLKRPNLDWWLTDWLVYQFNPCKSQLNVKRTKYHSTVNSMRINRKRRFRDGAGETRETTVERLHQIYAQRDLDEA
ncbi:hypothetical protein J6590_029017 [Homalodisca vitripennis]|nr:hypothetical protein J6590_029017 [Homalodisca vitripennis]